MSVALDTAVSVALTQLGWEPDAAGSGGWRPKGTAGTALSPAAALVEATKAGGPMLKGALQSTEFWLALAGTAGNVATFAAMLEGAADHLGQPWGALLMGTSQLLSAGIPVVYAVIRHKAKTLALEAKAP